MQIILFVCCPAGCYEKTCYVNTQQQSTMLRKILILCQCLVNSTKLFELHWTISCFTFICVTHIWILGLDYTINEYNSTTVPAMLSYFENNFRLDFPSKFQVKMNNYYLKNKAHLLNLRKP